MQPWPAAAAAAAAEPRGLGPVGPGPALPGLLGSQPGLGSGAGPGVNQAGERMNLRGWPLVPSETRSPWDRRLWGDQKSSRTQSAVFGQSGSPSWRPPLLEAAPTPEAQGHQVRSWYLFSSVSHLVLQVTYAFPRMSAPWEVVKEWWAVFPFPFWVMPLVPSARPDLVQRSTAARLHTVVPVAEARLWPTGSRPPLPPCLIAFRGSFQLFFLSPRFFCFVFKL